MELHLKLLLSAGRDDLGTETSGRKQIEAFVVGMHVYEVVPARRCDVCASGHKQTNSQKMSVEVY